jgi:DNA-binding SARP family transcriptional activator
MSIGTFGPDHRVLRRSTLDSMTHVDPSLALKALSPVAASGPAEHPCFTDAGKGGLTLLAAPPGHLLTEGLAAVLNAAGRGHIWVRLDADDGDPGVFLGSLAYALRGVGLGDSTLEQMRAHPGPAFGWAPLFERMGAELATGAVIAGGLVVEHIHHLRGPGMALSLVAANVLPPLRSAAVPVVLLTHHDVDELVLPAGSARRSRDDLVLPASVCADLLDTAPGPADRRLVDWCGGRAVAVAAVRAARYLMGASVDRKLVGAGDVGDLLERVARLLLSTVDDGGRHRLGLATVLEYDEAGPVPPGPWWQRLDGGLARLRTAWREPLRAALGADAMPDRDELRRMAWRLSQADATFRAVALYLEAGDDEAAASVIAKCARDLLDRGQWQTLEGWLARLGRDVLEGYPDLVHARGEIAAARGDHPAAQAWFDLASTRFVARGDLEGACRAMLGASTVAMTADDLETAQSRAAAARSLADAADQPDCLLWAGWQQASIELLTGAEDAALVAFDNAVVASTDEPVRTTGCLSREIVELRRRGEACRRTQSAVQRCERTAMRRLIAAVRDPADPKILAARGWSATPVALRLRSVSAGTAGPRTSRIDGWPTRVRRLPAEGTTAVDPGAGPAAVGPVIVVQLLGPLAVAIGDVPVQAYLGSRARSLLAYVVTHRDPWPTREMIAEALWPGADPDRSRNNLNVTIHGLRRGLRTASDEPVIVHSGAGYRLHPSVRLWLDVDDFDDAVRGGRRHDRAGSGDRAIAEYERAAGLYRSDFLADEPYEEWSAPTRDRLRFVWLDTVDRLSQLHFAAGRYARSAELCQRLIAHDACREEAHRRLMRCFSRQGQPHLALLQFRSCVRTLAADLRLQPDPSTVELYRRIRRHESV